MGYKLFFATGKMKFDEDHVPIVKVPALDEKKNKFLTINMDRALSNIHSDLFPLYFVSVGIRKLGTIPTPFQDMGPKEILFMKDSMKRMIRELAYLRQEWNSKKDEHFSFDMLLDETIKNRCSVPFAVMYAKKHSIERLDLGMNDGLLRMNVGKILERCFLLERDYSFFSKNNILAVRVANLWKEMGEL